MSNLFPFSYGFGGIFFLIIYKMLWLIFWPNSKGNCGFWPNSVVNFRSQTPSQRFSRPHFNAFWPKSRSKIRFEYLSDWIWSVIIQSQLYFPTDKVRQKVGQSFFVTHFFSHNFGLKILRSIVSRSQLVTAPSQNEFRPTIFRRTYFGHNIGHKQSIRSQFKTNQSESRSQITTFAVVK